MGIFSKHLLDLLGNEDKQIQVIGACCFRAINQPCHFDMCLAEPFTSAYMLDRSEQLISCALGALFVVR